MDAIPAGRQLRIEEDILGFDDETLAGLIFMAEHYLATPEPRNRERQEEKLALYKAERERRR